MKLIGTLTLVCMLSFAPGIYAQNVPVLNFPQLDSLLKSDNDTLYIFNFWATWCSPCVKELPAFEKITQHYAGKKLRVVLVSLDFRSDLEKKVLPFVKKRKLVSDVLLLDPGRGGEWIDKVAPEWSGAIPATLIVYGKADIRRFYEQSFEYEELNGIIKQLLGVH